VSLARISAKDSSRLEPWRCGRREAAIRPVRQLSARQERLLLLGGPAGRGLPHHQRLRPGSCLETLRQQVSRYVRINSSRSASVWEADLASDSR